MRLIKGLIVGVGLLVACGTSRPIKPWMDEATRAKAKVLAPALMERYATATRHADTLSRRGDPDASREVETERRYLALTAALIVERDVLDAEWSNVSLSTSALDERTAQLVAKRRAHANRLALDAARDVARAEAKRAFEVAGEDEARRHRSRSTQWERDRHVAVSVLTRRILLLADALEQMGETARAAQVTSALKSAKAKRTAADRLSLLDALYFQALAWVRELGSTSEPAHSRLRRLHDQAELARIETDVEGSRVALILSTSGRPGSRKVARAIALLRAYDFRDLTLETGQAFGNQDIISSVKAWPDATLRVVLDDKPGKRLWATIFPKPATH